MSLVQQSLEKEKIAAVSISIVPEITDRVPPARFLKVPYQLGFPLGPPDDFNNQVQICRQALQLLQSEVPVQEDYHEHSD